MAANQQTNPFRQVARLGLGRRSFDTYGIDVEPHHRIRVIVRERDGGVFSRSLRVPHCRAYGRQLAGTGICVRGVQTNAPRPFEVAGARLHHEIVRLQHVLYVVQSRRRSGHAEGMHEGRDLHHLGTTQMIAVHLRGNPLGDLGVMRHRVLGHRLVTDTHGYRITRRSTSRGGFAYACGRRADAGKGPDQVVGAPLSHTWVRRACASDVRAAGAPLRVSTRRAGRNRSGHQSTVMTILPRVCPSWLSSHALAASASGKVSAISIVTPPLSISSVRASRSPTSGCTNT
jgi:hypothetical protein